MHQRDQQYKILIDLAMKLTSSIQFKQDEILQLICQSASELMDTSNMHIAIYDEVGDFVFFPLAYKNGKKKSSITEDEECKKQGRTEHIIEKRKPVFCATKKEADEWYNQPGHGEFMKDTLASYIGVPMMAGEKVMGVVAAYHPTKDHVYNEDDLEILQAMANLAAIALQNARLYGELSTRLKAATHEIAEKQDIITKFTIAADFVHRLNNIAGTIPIWADSIKKKTEQMSDQIQDDINQMLHISEKAVTDKTIKAEYADLIYRLGNAVGTIPVRVKQHKDHIDHKVSKIQNDIKNLLKAVEQLDKPYEKVKTDINFILEVMLDQIHTQYDEKIKEGRIKIEDQIHSDLHRVLALPSTLANAIFNILSNGVESILTKGRGLLSVKAENYKDGIGLEGVRIKITDSGIGISREDMPKLFTLFFTTKGKKGSGYGLWIAINAIKDIGGDIKAESEKNIGATFTILLPKISGGIK